MKQLLQNLKDGKTIVADVPVPSVRPGFALVKNAASLVSAGTERMVVEFAEKNLVGKARSRPDLVLQIIDKARREGILTTVEATFNRLDQPMALGYSSAGTIIETGAGLHGFKPGERVACSGGGYAVHAEYVIVPQNLLIHLPDGLDFESAAFTTLGAIALQGFRLAQPQLGERVAVIGLGLLGLISVEIARAAGCSVFGVDINPKRIELARHYGAEATLREGAESIAQSFTGGRGFDTVLICADTKSDDPVILAGQIARDRGCVIAVGAVGMNIPRKIYYEKELQFLISRSYGPGRYDPTYEEKGQDYPIGYVRWTEGRNLESFVDLMANKRVNVKPLITHRFPIDQAAEAYSLITGKRQEDFLGVLLAYPELAQPTGQVSITDISSHLKTHIDIQPVGLVSKPDETPSLGILGAGNYATAVFLPVVKNAGGVNKTGIASASGLTARHAAQRYGFRYATSSEHDLLHDPDTNIIAVLSRHQHHARQVCEALQLGKHVYCEKPLAITLEELDRIAELLAKFNEPENQSRIRPVLTVGFNRRFAPLAIRLFDFLEGRHEPLYAHYRINAGYLPLTHWLHDKAVGGGRIIGEGCHFIDFITFLVGAPPIAVITQTLPDGNRYRQDNVIINLAFADGSAGVISYLANGDKSSPKERVEVFCAGRVSVLDDFRSLELVRDGRRKVYRSILRQDKGHLNSWKTFLAAVTQGAPLPIPYDQILAVTKASILAADQAAGGSDNPPDIGGNLH